MKQIRLIWAGVAAMTAAGCVSLLPETAPPKPRYHIGAVDGAAIQGPPVGWSLVVEDPRATRVYDTVKIAVSSSPGRVEYYNGAEWAARAPRLFQTAVIESFEDSGRILNIGDRSSIPLGDIILQMDIRRIQINVANRAETPRVVVFARLTDGKGRVYASRLFTAESAASGRDADAVLAAFGAAFEAVITEIVLWTYEEGAAAIARA